MSESAALETAENCTSCSTPQQLEGGGGDVEQARRPGPGAAAVGARASTSPVASCGPPVVQISSPPDQGASGEEDAGGDTSSGSASDNAHTPSGKIRDKSSDDGGGQNAEWTPPDEALQAKIIKQVEFYFSDGNITKDAFLLKHVRRNKEGFVSLKLITSFKKVKSLTKDWRTVRHSLRSSTTLEINKEGTKVKRKAPLPDYDETTPSRTVVAINLPTQNPSIESIAELFNKCGEISLIRVLRPGKPFPPDVRKHIERHSEIRNKVCALIEFENGQSALKAAKTMTDKDNWRTGMSVSVLAKEKKKDKKQPQEKSNNRRSSEGLSLSQARDLTASDSGEAGDSAKKKKRQRKKKNIRVDELSGEVLELPSTPSSSDTDNSPLPSRKHSTKPIGIPQSKSPARLSPGNTPKGSPSSSPHGSPRQQRKVVGRSPLAKSPRNSPRGSPELGRKTNMYDSVSDHSNTSSPWVQRRRLLAAAAPDGSPAGSPLLGRKNLLHSNDHEAILRTPFGPDGTKGFSLGRGRGIPK